MSDDVQVGIAICLALVAIAVCICVGSVLHKQADVEVARTRCMEVSQ